VPNVASDTPALRTNPVFMYFEDECKKPAPFSPDIAVSIDDVIDRKVAMLDAHVSQFYEWLAWHDGQLAQVPASPDDRRAWLKKHQIREIPPAVRASLVARYGPAAQSVTHAEAFEICEYGARPDEAAIRRLFPFFPSK
jgi:LmbE family N-acetylglucosaminyl deacetylase